MCLKSIHDRIIIKEKKDAISEDGLKVYKIVGVKISNIIQ